MSREKKAMHVLEGETLLWDDGRNIRPLRVLGNEMTGTFVMGTMVPNVRLTLEGMPKPFAGTIELAGDQAVQLD